MSKIKAQIPIFGHYIYLLLLVVKQKSPNMRVFGIQLHNKQ